MRRGHRSARERVRAQLRRARCAAAAPRGSRASTTRPLELGGQRASRYAASSSRSTRSFAARRAGEADRDDRGDPPCGAAPIAERAATAPPRRRAAPAAPAAAARAAGRNRARHPMPKATASQWKPARSASSRSSESRKRLRRARRRASGASTPRSDGSAADVRQPAPFPQRRGAVLLHGEPRRFAIFRPRSCHTRVALRLTAASPRFPARASWRRCRGGRRCGRRPALPGAESPVAPEIALPLELHRLVGIRLDRGRLDHRAGKHLQRIRIEVGGEVRNVRARAAGRAG